MEFLKAVFKKVNMSFLASNHSAILTAQTTKSHRRSDEILLKKKKLY